LNGGFAPPPSDEDSPTVTDAATPAIFGSPTFNIVDLKPYFGEEDELELRTTQMQEGEDDVDINTSDTSTQISGPITQARAR
jgi:hypothetical protein